MIDYIKYTVDNATYCLTNNGDDTWSRDGEAPSIAGNYQIIFTISENGIVTTVDSSNSLYETYLNVVVETERVVYLEKLVPDFVSSIYEFAKLFEIENENFDNLHANIERIKSDVFITTASNDSITRVETFIGIKGIGTLEQRKSYLVSLNRKGNKLKEASMKGIVNSISGSDCNVTFFGADESDNPLPGYGLIRVRVLSPDTSKNYRYEDIERSLKPLMPAHIRLLVVRYFALWDDIQDNYTDWEAVKEMDSWQVLKDYIPPE